MTVAVVGAGIGGLAAAYDLVRAGKRVVVLEAADHPGGLAAGFKLPRWDWSVERYYHHWFASDRHILGLIDELGWSDRVFFPWPTTAVYHQGKFYPMDAPLASLLPLGKWVNRLPAAGMLARAARVLTFPGLPLTARLRSGLVGFYLTLTRNWQPLEQHTADRWLRAKMGDKAYEVMWKPLLEGKFGPHYEQVNMAWFWARVKARTPRLGTYEGGFQAFADDLAERLLSMGVDLRYRTPVQRIERNDGGLMIQAESGPLQADQCLVTTSPALLARMAPSLPASYLERLLSLKSMGAVVLILALRQRLSEQGIYWHNLPKQAGFPFLALVEHTNYLSPEFFGGDHIVYCGDYLDPDHEYFSLTQPELEARFFEALPRFNSAFEPGWVRDSWLFRTPYAQPVPPVNHSESIPPLATPIEGLWLASMSQVYPWDRGTNFAVEIGRRAARRMVEAGQEPRA
ncbi:MAG TPA: NAD(P)/FAD-dependent oxidoreductase [Anaerolineales bacterium]|jgi:protoporphyrinogen oxidase